MVTDPSFVYRSPCPTTVFKSEQLKIHIAVFKEFPRLIKEQVKTKEQIIPILKEIERFAVNIRCTQDQILESIKNDPSLKQIIENDFDSTIQKVSQIARSYGLKEIQTQRLQRFKKIVLRIKENFTRTFYNGKKIPHYTRLDSETLYKYYCIEPLWSEIYNKEKTKILLEGHIYPFKGSYLRGYIQQWLERHTSGISHQIHHGFFEYLSVFCAEVIENNPAILANLKRGLVSCYEPSELDTLKAAFSNGRIGMRSPHFPDWLKSS